MRSFSTQQIAAARAYQRQRDDARHKARESRRLERLAAARQAIRDLALEEPALSAVYLFGSILRPGRFIARSDIDVAVDSADPAADSRFWRALEESLDLPVDVRPRTGAVATAVELAGECVYERSAARS